MLKISEQLKLSNCIVVKNLPDAEYRQAKGLSQSMLSHFIQSPKHYLHACENPIEPTPDMLLGLAFHSLMLEKEPSYVVKKKVDGRTTEGKKYNAEFEIENKGKIIINEEQEFKVWGMRKSFLESDSLATKLYNETKQEFREVSLFCLATTPYGEVHLKGRLDGFHEQSGTIWDFKKCQDASADGFEKMVRERNYWLQNAMYQTLGMACKLDVKDFIYIPIEGDAPHGFGSYSFDISKKMKYKPLSPFDYWHNAIVEFTKCQSEGNWRGYSSEKQIISI